MNDIITLVQVITVILALVVVYWLARVLQGYGFRRVTVLEYQRGLKYTRGKFAGVLEPGEYWIMPAHTSVVFVDTRPRYTSVHGQEVLSKDGISIKVSLAVHYEITDPEVAVNKVEDYYNALYTELQIALRALVGEQEIDQILDTRAEMGRKLTGMVAPRAAALGLALHAAEVRDIMFPGPLKAVFAQIVKARKEGQAALEKARAETAALRNLANVSKLLEDHPALLQLRVLQSFEQGTGNTMVLGMPAESASGIQPPGPSKADGTGSSTA